MAEQIGIVIAHEADGMARVLTDRKGACGGCHSGHHHGCRSCLAGSAKIESEVVNPIGAGIGDVVKITLSQADLFKGASLMYLLPIAALIGGAVLGLWLGGAFGGENAGSVAGGLAGLGLGLWTVKRLGGSRGLRRRLTPAVSAVVIPSGERQGGKSLRQPCCG